VAGDYEVSAHYVSSLAKVLEHRRLLHASPSPAAPLLESPWARWWWPGSLAESVFVAVGQQAGPAAVREVVAELLQQHMLPGLGPAVSWLLSLSGVRPSTLFARMDLLSTTLLRGVSFDWRADGPSAGVLRVRYPSPAQDPQVLAEVWRPIFEQVFHLTHTAGEVTGIDIADGVLEARLSW